MIFQNILVPLDGSEHSARALETAIQVAKQLNSKLTLLTVYHVTVIPATSPELTMHTTATVPDATSAGLAQMAIQSAHNFGKKTLSEAEAKVKSENIPVKTELVGGDAVGEIVRKSKEGNFDLIVMGARGLGTIKKIFIGSVSEGVLKNTPCPVLIVK